jgi:Flp pilus assembly protein TadD
VTIKPRFCVVVLALALAGAPAGVSFAQSMGGSGENPHSSRTTLDPIPPEGGWDGLAKLLEAAKPGVDTRLEPSPSQITTHIERMLNRGENEAALAMIEKRQNEIKDQRGTDVQLMFQHARALAALNRTNEAIDVYTEMTTRFPELPEPWNNLAALYASRGELEKAQDALQMALRADPGYAAARANLGDLQLMQALRTYKKAAGDGVPGMKEKVREVETLLKDKQGK